MGVAVYIACESEIDGEDTSVDGKSLGRVDPEVLEKIENQVGCQHIYDMMSFDPGEMGDYLDDIGEANLPPVEWHPASDGLSTVRALREHITAHPSAVPKAEDVLADLDDMERVLQVLEKHDVKFHFAVDA